MRLTHNRYLTSIALVAVPILLTACDAVPKSAVQPGEARFVVKEDSQGRLLRIDTVTGKVTIVDIPSAKSGAARKNTTDERVEDKSGGSSVVAHTPEPAFERTSEPASACNQTSTPQTVTVAINNAPLFIQPRVLQVPLTNLSAGSALPVDDTHGDWYLVRFNDVRWGSRVGYIHCGAVRVPSVPVSAEASSPLPSATTSAPAASRPSDRDVDITTNPSALRTGDQKRVQPQAKSETIAGYVEWLRGDHLVADGQRVRWNDRTKLKLGRLPSITRIPLGYEIKVKGVRQADGALLAHQLEVKPNGIAAYENEVTHGFDQIEAAWIMRGMAYDSDGKGNLIEIGRIVDSGPDVERARRILNSLLPPYVSPGQLRLRVIQSSDWQASAMQNGGIWVHKGLLDDVSDDELAAVLGHELAHYTHEHGRRRERNGALIQLVAIGAGVGIDQVRNAEIANALALAGNLSLSAWKNGYSREHEDQSDRVGLRYAYEAGYDVTAAVTLWSRARARDGEPDPIRNFFWATHSRPTDRIKNIERELHLNYPAATAK